MRGCPICDGDPSGVEHGCAKCGIRADTEAAWDALPRVRDDAEALVDTLENEVAGDERYGYDSTEHKDARAALLRACVVDEAQAHRMNAVVDRVRAAFPSSRPVADDAEELVRELESRLIDEVAALEKERNAARHRDGGQRTGEVGLAHYCANATAAFYRLRAMTDALVEIARIRAIADGDNPKE